MSLVHSRAAFSLVAVIMLGALVVAAGTDVQASAQTRSAAQTPLSGSPLYGQPYSGTVQGGYLWENNSFPFQAYAANSTILALPAISSWLSANGYSPAELRPYLTMWPSGENPYDFSQGIGYTGGVCAGSLVNEPNRPGLVCEGSVVGGTYFYEYQYVVTGTTQVISASVADNSSQTVFNIFTYSYVGSWGVSSAGGAGNFYVTN